MLVDGINLTEGSDAVNLVVKSVTTTERDALTNVDAGEMVFNTTVGHMQAWTGTAWENLAGSSITNVSELTNDAGYQTAAQVATVVAGVVDSAPATLDTLNELAAALGDDANFASTVTNSLAGKQATLVSGTNIKTINSTSLLGSGDIAVAAKATLNGVANTISDGIGNLRSMPMYTNSTTSNYAIVAADNGKQINLSSTGTASFSNVMAAGDAFAVYNQTASSINVTFSGLTAYKVGSTTAITSPIALTGRSLLSVVYVSASEVLVSGI